MKLLWLILHYTGKINAKKYWEKFLIYKVIFYSENNNIELL